jgi:uncharacterized membrane protein
MRPSTALLDKGVRALARGALIASLYVALTFLFAGVSFAASQVRVAEALTVLPFLIPEAVWGIAVGVALANLFSPFGTLDILFGSFLSLSAALATYGIGRLLKPYLATRAALWLAIFLAPLPPVLFNAFGVSFYLLQFGLLSDYTYWGLAASILVGQTIACYVLGGPLLFMLTMRVQKTGNLF